MKYQFIKLDDIEHRFEYRDDRMSSFIVINKTEEIIEVEVDKIASILFYYIVIDGVLYGARTMDLLVDCLPKNFKRKLNPLAAITLIRTQTMMGDLTLLDGVKSIRPGHKLLFNKYTKELSIIESIKLPTTSNKDYFNTTKALKDYHEAYSKVIREITSDSSKHYGMHLTGGLDSRQLLGEVVENNIKVDTFFYGAPNNIDMDTAIKLSNQFQFKYHAYKWNNLEGFLDFANNRYGLFDYTQSLPETHGFDIFLDIEKNGKDLDNLSMFYTHFCDFFAQAHGYKKEFKNKKIDNCKFEELWINGSFSQGDISNIFNLKYSDIFEENVHKEVNLIKDMQSDKKYDILYLNHHTYWRLMQQIRAESKIYDTVVPCLNDNVFNVAWAIPGEIKKHRVFQQKYIEQYYQNVLSQPIVRDNYAMNYLGKSNIKKMYYKLFYYLSSRKVIKLKKVWGDEFTNMYKKDVLPTIKKEIIEKGYISDSGIFKDKFIENELFTDKYKNNFTLIGSIYSVHKFIENIILNSKIHD